MVRGAVRLRTAAIRCPYRPDGSRGHQPHRATAWRPWLRRPDGIVDIVDANVVEGALRRGDLIITSGEGDLAAIAAAISRHIEIDHP
jgi:hypothetical protein